MKTAKQVIQRIKTIAVKEVGGVHFDHKEATALRELAEYLMRGFVGPHTGTLKMILEKVPR
jgi:hypothetical protein